jgi:uncharacterized protein (DUF2236 family)
VDRHSSYREDPFGRLQRTGAFIAATTYGSQSLAEQTIGAIQSMHARVQGTAPDGRPYSAQDPRLLLWVHIALTDSMLRAYLDYGRDGRIDADGYVSDMAVVARAMGVLDPPTTVAELVDAFTDFRPELRVDADVRRTQRFILDAPMPLTLKPGYRVLARAAWNSLPPWALTMLDSSPRLATVDRGARRRLPAHAAVRPGGLAGALGRGAAAWPAERASERVSPSRGSGPCSGP